MEVERGDAAPLHQLDTTVEEAAHVLRETRPPQPFQQLPLQCIPIHFRGAGPEDARYRVDFIGRELIELSRPGFAGDSLALPRSSKDQVNLPRLVQRVAGNQDASSERFCAGPIERSRRQLGQTLVPGSAVDQPVGADRDDRPSCSTTSASRATSSSRLAVLGSGTGPPGIHTA